MLLILSYALYRKDIVFILGNGISLALTGILMALRYKYNVNTKQRERLNIKQQE